MPDNAPSVDLSHLRALAPDWDSYGAHVIAEPAIATAQAIAFVPSPDGGVQIELYAGDAEIEIEIGPDGFVDTVLWGRPRHAR